jgi:hypothetical protein
LNKPGNFGSVAYKSGDEVRVLLSGSVSLNYDLVPLKSCEATSEPETWWFNCIIEDTELEDYFENSATTNWAVWLLIGFLMGYFLCTAL